MTLSTRRTAQRYLKQLLSGASSWLHERPSGNFPPSSSSPSLSSACQVSSVSTVNELPAGLFNVPCVVPRGGLRHNFGYPETLETRMTIQQFRRAKVSGSEVKVGFVIERKGQTLSTATFFYSTAAWKNRKKVLTPDCHTRLRITARYFFKFDGYQVLKTQHTTQGRGGALIQVELRDVQTGLKSSARLRTSEAVEKVFVDEKSFTFLYKEDQTVYLMDPTTFEQVEVPMSYFETGAVYLTDGMDVTLQYFDGKPLSASVPPRVTCTVAEAEPYFKGQTATPSYKKVVLENGQKIMTPTFISAGDVIVVDTTDDSYVTRSKS